MRTLSYAEHCVDTEVQGVLGTDLVHNCTSGWTHDSIILLHIPWIEKMGNIRTLVYMRA